ncbi:SHOCT domain-containing protein [Weissella koreensis]|uniref:SHOCT domain-containing protein n=2 Tax=Weissella koreensis TaxID=165096 RepID=A0A7H1MKZ0_9LACO|nr:hypothetical protein GKC51_02315 [Weissella koreensis]QNT64126.1 SHOCT domain-containing protein [Weissella koreensis]
MKMDDSKIQRLKELQDLYQSDALTQNEFEKMKAEILSEDLKTTDPLSKRMVEAKKVVPTKQIQKRSKKSHKIRNIGLLIILIGLVSAGGYAYLNQQDDVKKSSSVTHQKSASTSRAATRSKTKVKSKPRENNREESHETSSSSSQSSKFAQDDDAVEMFHSLDQKQQLGAMYSFAALKDQSDTSWSDSSIISADLNTEQQIILSPVPGDARIVLIDNYDETFDYEIYHVDSVVDKGTVSTTQLNSIAQNDTQINTWASSIRMKDADE